MHAGEIASMLIPFCTELGVICRCVVCQNNRFSVLIHKATLHSVMAGVFFGVKAPGIVGPCFLLIPEIYTDKQHTF